MPRDKAIGPLRISWPGDKWWPKHEFLHALRRRPGIGLYQACQLWFSLAFTPKAARSSKPGSAQVRHSGEDFGGMSRTLASATTSQTRIANNNFESVCHNSGLTCICHSGQVPERNLVQGKGRRSIAIESATAGMTLTRAGLNLLMHSFSLRNHKIHGMVLERYDIVHFQPCVEVPCIFFLKPMLKNVGNVSRETFRSGLRNCFSDLLGVSYRYGMQRFCGPMVDHEMGLLQCKQPFEARVCILRTHMFYVWKMCQHLIAPKIIPKCR